VLGQRNALGPNLSVFFYRDKLCLYCKTSIVSESWLVKTNLVSARKTKTSMADAIVVSAKVERGELMLSGKSHARRQRIVELRKTQRMLAQQLDDITRKLTEEMQQVRYEEAEFYRTHCETCKKPHLGSFGDLQNRCVSCVSVQEWSMN
jgi:hypothetical protein